MRNGDYELIKPPADYPGMRYRGKYAYRHRVNSWLANGYLPECVHHKNEQKRDDSPENLQGIGRSEHQKLHAAATPAKMITLVCGWCAKAFESPLRNYKPKVKKGQRMFFCCRLHAVLRQHRVAGHRVPSPLH